MKLERSFTNASFFLSRLRPFAFNLARETSRNMAGLASDAQSMCDSIDAEWRKFNEAADDTAESPAAAPKKRPAPKAKAKEAAAKAGKRRKCAPRPCRGCRIKIKPEEMANNWPGCWPCKRALDNITKLASRQGKKQQEFVSQARVDED